MPKKKQKAKPAQSRRPSDGPLHELAEQVAVGLTPSQGKALLAFIAGKKKQDAARIAAVHPNRIGIWLTNDPYFYMAYVEAMKWITSDQLHALGQEFRSLDAIEEISWGNGVDPESQTLAARHFKNGWIPKDQCFQRHSDYGLAGDLHAKMEGYRHLARYTTATYTEPIRFRGVFRNDNCLKCHAGTPPTGVRPFILDKKV